MVFRLDYLLSDGLSAVPHERDRRVFDDAPCGHVANPVPVAPLVLGVRRPPDPVLGHGQGMDKRSDKKQSQQRTVSVLYGLWNTVSTGWTSGATEPKSSVAS